MGQGEINRDPSSEREPHDVGLFYLEVIEQPGKVVGVRVKQLGSRRAAIAAYVIPDHAEMLGKRVKLIVPHPAVQLTTMDQNDGRSGSLDLIKQARPPDWCEPMSGVLKWFSDHSLAKPCAML